MDDRILLNEAVRQRQYWDIVYYARRLMRADSRDPHACAALSAIPGAELSYRDTVSGRPRINPLLGPMDPPLRLELIRSGEIVECDRGEILFRRGDAGDAMFVVLHGEIGVSFDPASTPLPDEAPRIRIDAGEIAGELAFALRRRRTATLYCLTPVRLLSFNPRAVDEMTGRAPEGAAMRRALSAFLLARTLEHLCNNLDYLIGRDRQGPLRDLDEPWLLLAEYASLIEGCGGPGRTVSSLDRDFERPGLYLLASGELRDLACPERVLEGTGLPIVFANLPQAGLAASARYAVATDVVIVRIGADAFADRLIPPDAARALFEAIHEAAAAQPSAAA